MPGGRPSKYDPAYCDKVIELGRMGKSQIQIAVALDVPRTTLLSWGDQHPEFAEALTRAKECEQDWWETAGQTGMYTPGFNATVWQRSVISRFKGDYSERRELSGPNGGPVEVTAVSARQRRAALALALAAKAADDEG